MRKMKQKIFIFDKYGVERTLAVGQKVICDYYHEYSRRYEKSAYKRTLLSKMIDKPFKPVKFGVIVGDAGVHPYWLGKDRKEQYLFVKFKEYFLPKPIPISCIKDALSESRNTAAFIEMHKNKIGEKGFSYESMNFLDELAHKGLEFVK
jgi:hypothetical protein